MDDHGSDSTKKRQRSIASSLKGHVSVPGPKETTSTSTSNSSWLEYIRGARRAARAQQQSPSHLRGRSPKRPSTGPLASRSFTKSSSSAGSVAKHWQVKIPRQMVCIVMMVFIMIPIAYFWWKESHWHRHEHQEEPSVNKHPLRGHHEAFVTWMEDAEKEASSEHLLEDGAAPTTVKNGTSVNTNTSATKAYEHDMHENENENERKQAEQHGGKDERESGIIQELENSQGNRTQAETTAAEDHVDAEHGSVAGNDHVDDDVDVDTKRTIVEKKQHQQQQQQEQENMKNTKNEVEREGDGNHIWGDDHNNNIKDDDKSVESQGRRLRLHVIKKSRNNDADERRRHRHRRLFRHGKWRNLENSAIASTEPFSFSTLLSSLSSSSSTFSFFFLGLQQFLHKWVYGGKVN